MYNIVGVDILWRVINVGVLVYIYIYVGNQVRNDIK